MVPLNFRQTSVCFMFWSPVPLHIEVWDSILPADAQLGAWDLGILRGEFMFASGNERWILINVVKR